MEVQSLLDLEVGKVYFKEGSSYLIKNASEDEIICSIDNKKEVTIPLDRETIEHYLDAVLENREDKIFFRLKRDEE